MESPASQSSHPHPLPRANGCILYSSFQEGPALPGFIRYALAGLSRTGLPVVLLTNRRELDSESTGFLAAHRIEVFFTVNRGFDFGMWRRYLDSIPEETRNSWERLLLVNDSIVYYRDVFHAFLDAAEARPADMVSLTCNRALAFHLQSFFLYLKPPAIPIFFRHLLNQPEQTDYKAAVRKLEVGLSQAMFAAGLSLEALFPTKRNPQFFYADLIRQKAGFVKRRFLDGRFTLLDKIYFWRHFAGRALATDYIRLIEQDGGMAPDFQPEWLRPPRLRPVNPAPPAAARPG